MDCVAPGFLTGIIAYRKLLVASLLLGCAASIFAQSVHRSLQKGDREYDLDHYKAAEKQYRVAADLEYSNPKALYNLGNALYQQGSWEDAAERFGQAANFATTPVEQANALHNLGNAFLKQRKFKEAITAYQKSLHLRPGDDDTKTNLQMAKKKLQEEEQKQQQKQQQSQDNQSQSGDQQQPQNQSQQPQNQQDPQQQQPQNQPGKNQQGQPQQPDQQPEQKEQGKLKKEEAQRILETAVGPEDQRNARKYRSAQRQSKPKGSGKDW